jgi:flagellin
MRINHNIAAMVTQGAMFKVNREVSRSLEKLSTGLRINRASDDAAGMAVSEGLRTQVRGTAQAMRNALDGIGVLNIAEGAANEVSEILQRMRELAVQSSSDTFTSTERVYNNTEYSQLINEIDRIAQVTNFNGMKLLSSSGSSSAERFGIGGTGGTGSALWIDANSAYGVDSITITIDSLSSTDLGAGAQSGGVASLNASVLTSQSDAVSAIQQLDESIQSVNMLRANIGAFVNRLEHAINNLTISNTNQAASESIVRDVDFAFETTQFTRNQILMQSSTAMLSQANIVPQSVLQLLGG